MQIGREERLARKRARGRLRAAIAHFAHCRLLDGRGNLRVRVAAPVAPLAKPRDGVFARAHAAQESERLRRAEAMDADAEVRSHEQRERDQPAVHEVGRVGRERVMQ